MLKMKLIALSKQHMVAFKDPFDESSGHPMLHVAALTRLVVPLEDAMFNANLLKLFPRFIQQMAPQTNCKSTLD